MNLVLLHPLPLDSSVWPEQVTGLAERCIAPDLYSLGDDIEDWARAVLDLAGDAPLSVVGNSVGGSCAIELALLAPEKVTALVLIGTKAGHNPEPGFRDQVLRLLDDEGVEAAWDRYWRPLFDPHAQDHTIWPERLQWPKALPPSPMVSGSSTAGPIVTSSSIVGRGQSGWCPVHMTSARNELGRQRNGSTAVSIERFRVLVTMSRSKHQGISAQSSLKRSKRHSSKDKAWGRPRRR